MKRNMKHFPFLFLLFIFFNCNNKKSKTDQNNFDYTGYIEKAFIKETSVELDSAFYYFNKAKLTCNADDKEKKIYALLGMANIQKTNCDFAGLEETATEALSIYDQSIYKEHLTNYLGIAYNEQFNYNEALYYYNKTYLTTKKEIDRITIKNNIAVNYIDQKEYAKSIAVLKKIVQNDTLKVNPDELARVNDNLGYAYFKIKNDSLALLYLEAGLKIRDSIANEYEKIASYIHLSEFYKNRNSILSKSFADKALKSATIVNSPDDKLEALDLLIKNPTNTNLIKDFEKYSFINDSISKVRQIAKNQFAKIKYDSNLAIEKSEKLKTQNSLMLLLLIGFGIIGILTYFLIRSKNKGKLQRASYETETRISKQLHDELANDVYNTMTFAETQDLSNPNKKEKFLNQIETIYNRTRNISLENSEIDTGNNFKKCLFELISSYSNDSTNVIVKNYEAINWNKTKSITKITTYRVMQELLINMKKHSHSTVVVIGFESKNKTYEINYSDNGIGISKMLKFKNGLKNVESRIKNINGSFNFETESQKGFKAKIVFPK